MSTTWFQPFSDFLFPWRPLILALCALALTLVIWSRSRNRNLPPGPTGLPILGYLPFLGKVAYKKLYALSRKYGAVYSLYLGRKFVVVLNDFDVVKEALSNPVIMDRPPHPPNHLMPDSTSLSTTNGAAWREQRNFAVQALRKLGMGKEEMEERILAEVRLLEQKVDRSEGRPVNFARLVLPSVSNVVLSLLDSDRERIQKGRALLDSVLTTMTLYFRPTRVHAYFPALRPWFERYKIWGYDEVKKKMDVLSEFIKHQVDCHRETLDDTCVRDYIDAFLIAQKEGKRGTFTDEMLRGNLQSLLGAGSTPARTAIEWCLVSVAMHPNVQGRVYQELLEAVGPKKPRWSDRHSTPYTMAVIMESMRHHTVIPISMLRTNSQPCRIASFDIPSDTIIMTNLWAVHHDPAHWERPNDFWPEHFLIDGKIIKPPAFIPFSYGKRNCPGEDMAMMEVYLYFVSLVQKYQVFPKDRAHGFKTILGIANMAVPDDIRMLRRPKAELKKEAISETRDNGYKQQQHL